MARRWVGTALVAVVLQVGCNLILGNEDHPMGQDSTGPDGGTDATVLQDAGPKEAGPPDSASSDVPLDHADAAEAPDATGADSALSDAASESGCGSDGQCGRSLRRSFIFAFA